MAKKAKNKSFLLTDKWIIIGLGILGFILYANTLGHDFALDDAIVITDNEFTQKGFGGLADIFTKDTFHGFFGESGKDKLVSGGRYRPFTLGMFAIERAIFGTSPFIHHLINILLYAFLSILIFLTAQLLFQQKFQKETAQYLALGLAAIFLAHPIHTEAVANIKGRDEIMAMLGSISAVYILARKQFQNLTFKDYLFSGLVFFVGLLSKENAITFVAVAPLIAYVFYKKPIQAVLPFLVSAIIFMIIRTSVIGLDLGAVPSGEFMNNPYLKIVNGQYTPFTSIEKFSTICYTLWKYISLMVFPWPLTHDYYPNHISLKTFSNPMALAGLISYIGLFIASIYGILKKKTWAFFTAYYLITISIVSNIVFPIGTHMSERFIFMPSFAFAGLVSLLLFKSKPKIGFLALAVLVAVYSIMTVKRNLVWKDNYTLFTTDALTSKNSAKVNNAAGGVIGDYVKNLPESPERDALINKGHTHLANAIAAHPNYVNAYLLKGNLYFYQDKYEEALQMYNTSLAVDPQYTEAISNKFLALRSAGRYYGEKKNDLSTSAQYLEQALQLQPNDYETNRLLGTCYGIMGNHQNALKYFKKCAELQPNNADIFVNLAKAYELTGNTEEAAIAARKAQSLGNR
ncbi:tetratricopeptide repeat protein [Portibacter lacus]|uniref:tetratricopeptide repeat protein n=1 Tax=Portibacter lacus TaxID=1099794 RepID=UPI001F31E797|nr:tetratricopeptide repeat protein [Portibacter lacus]